jgi:N-acetyl sugar amidotransferase
MKISPSSTVDLTRYQRPYDELEVLYGLPRDVRFCAKCNMSNQQPMSSNEYAHGAESTKATMQFDDEGVCHACRFNELKANEAEINWPEREQELIELCDRYRRNDGSYDCIVGGSGGKDSAMQSHLLKYKYGMNPLTVTWSPHLYTDIGWKNFQNWLHVGGFDNYLFTPNGKIHRLLTRNATINLLHPFQPFIIGQKTFVAKMAAKLNIPLIFYGEMPGEYGEQISHKTSNYAAGQDAESEGFQLDYYRGRDVRDMLLGGKSIGEYIEEGVSLADLKSYLPMENDILIKKGIDWKYLGYYVRWVPQEAYYYAVEHTGFEANPVRTEGTYSKYNSLDDKVDGFFYYTRWIKFGVGRAMMDSAQEIRNQHITKEEGLALMERYEGEYPERYETEFLKYVGMSREEFFEVVDRFRSPHLWQIVDGEWKLRHTPWTRTDQRA